MRNMVQPLWGLLRKMSFHNARTLEILNKQPFASFCSDSSADPSKTFGTNEESQSRDKPGETGFPRCSKDVKIILKKQRTYEVPMRKTLASTNKMLFGPLLETSREKKKRLKREAKGITESEYTKKYKKKGKKKQETCKVQPLIFSPENSHHLLSDYAMSLKQKAYLSSQSHDIGRPGHQRKIIIISSANTRKNCPVVEDLQASHNSLSNDFGIDYISHDVNSKGNCGVNMNLPANIEDMSSFLPIDNSRFPAVPQTLNIAEMENFPMFSQISSLDFAPCNDSERNNITSIGIFDGGYQKLPSVRNILEETMPLSNKISLERWKKKMIKELGEDGFQKYRQDLLTRGKFLHECIQSELSGAPLMDEHTVNVREFWRSLKPVLPNVKDIKVLESRLIHPYLYYQGAVDCVASYRGIPMLIEWKTSSKPKLSVKSMFDDPLQVVAYLGALHYDSNYKLPQMIESAMLVVAYESGLPAHVHLLKKEDCQHYWKIWCSRLCQFWNMHKAGAIHAD